MKICAIRIDARLIHGQVATLWQGTWQCHRIMVIDAASANDPILKSVLKIACPPGVKLSVLDPETAAANLVSGRYADERITIVTKTPKNIIEMIHHGFEFDTPITVGNMSNAEGKLKITKSVSASKEEIEIFKTLSAQGHAIVSQMVPSEGQTDFMPLLEKALNAK